MGKPWGVDIFSHHEGENTFVFLRVRQIVEQRHLARS